MTSRRRIKLARALADKLKCRAGRVRAGRCRDRGVSSGPSRRPCRAAAARPSFGDIIAKDKFSPLHVISAGPWAGRSRRCSRCAAAWSEFRCAGAELRSRRCRRRAAEGAELEPSPRSRRTPCWSPTRRRVLPQGGRGHACVAAGFERRHGCWRAATASRRRRPPPAVRHNRAG